MLLERQQSSALCSTSYACPSYHATDAQLKRGRRTRCSAHLRSQHVVPSSEQALPSKHAPIPRPSAAAASTAWAPSSRHRRSLPPPPSPPPPDLLVATSIPNAIPSLEDLQHLHHRAARTGSETTPAPTTAPSSPSRRDPSSLGLPPHSQHQQHEDRRVQTSRATRGGRRSVTHQHQQPQTQQQQQPWPATPSPQQPPPQPQPHPQPRPQPRHRYTARPMQLTLAIKAVRDWRRLPQLLEGLRLERPGAEAEAEAEAGAEPAAGWEDGVQGGRSRSSSGSGSRWGGGGGTSLDSFNAVALLTHLAQRVAAEGRQLGREELRAVEGMQATVLAVVGSRLHELRARQVSNLTWALARLGLPSGAEFTQQQLLPLAHSLMPWFEPQHLSNTLWALATAGVSPSDCWLAEWLGAAFTALQRRALAPQHLANVLWALERLGVVPDQEWLDAYYDCVSAALPACNAQDCSNILSTLALLSMQRRAPDPTARLAAGLAERLRQLLHAEQQAAAAAAAAVAGAAAPAAASSAVGRAVDGSIREGTSQLQPRRPLPHAAAAAAAGAAPAAMEAAVLTPTPARAGACMAPQSAAGAAPAGGSTLAASPVDTSATRAAAGPAAHTAPANTAAPSAPAAVLVSDQSLANSMWALAVMGLDPGEPLWAAVTAAMHTRMCTPPGAATQQPPTHDTATVSSTHSAGPGSSTSGSRSGTPFSLPNSGSSSSSSGGCSGSSLHPTALGVLVWAASALQRPLPGRVTDALYDRVRGPQLEGWEPQALATLVWSLATAPAQQPRPPAAWVAEVVAVSGRGIQQMGAQSTSNLLYGLCQLAVRPPPEWMSALVNHVHRNLAQEASSQSVSNVLWCLAKMGYRLTPEGMQLLLRRLVTGRLADWAAARSHWAAQQQQQLQQRDVQLQKLHMQGQDMQIWQQEEQQQHSHSQPLQLHAHGSEPHHPHHHDHPPHHADDRHHSSQEQQSRQWQADLAWPQAAASAPTPPSSFPSPPAPPPPPPPPPPPFSSQELSNLLYALAQQGHTPDAALRPLLLAALRAGLAEARPQELGNTMWSLAALKICPSDAWLHDFFTAASARLPDFQPGDLAQILYGTAKLRLQPGLQQPPPSPSSSLQPPAVQNPHSLPPTRAPRSLFGPASDPSSTSADATMSTAAAAAEPSATTSPSSSSCPASSSSSCPAAFSAFLSSALVAAPRLVSSAGPQELCNLAWALVQLGVELGEGQQQQQRQQQQGRRPPSQPLTRQQGALLRPSRQPQEPMRQQQQAGPPQQQRQQPPPQQQQQQTGPGAQLAAAFTARLAVLSRGGCSPAQLALGVWALGKWGVRPGGGQAAQLEVASFRMMPSMRPHELAALLSGFAGMCHTPPSDWVEEALQQVVARSRQLGPQEWTVVLLALSRLQARDDSLRPRAEELAGRLAGRLGRLPLPAVVLLAYSCGCMGAGRTAAVLVGRCLALLAEGEEQEQEELAEEEDVRGGGRGGSRRHGSGGGEEEEEEEEEEDEEGQWSAAADSVDRLLAAATRQGGPLVAAEAAAAAAVPPVASSSAAAAAAGAAAARPVRVSSLRAEELSALLWSAVRVGLRALPGGFRDHFFRHTQPLLPTLPASLVASFLWSAGRLRVWAPGGWRLALLLRAEQEAGRMRPRELSMCLAGLVWLRLGYSSRLLAKLHAALQQQGPRMPPPMRQHAERAMQLLARRLAAADRRDRRHGPRAAWLTRVRQGNVGFGGDVDGGKGRGGGAAERPVGRLTRRGALRASVVRRRPSRLVARKAPEERVVQP